MITVKIQGLSELQEKLNKMPHDVAKRVLRTDLRKAGESMKEAMVAAAPKDTGFLSEHFNVRTRFEHGELAATTFVGPAGKTYYPNKGNREKGIATGKHAKKGGAIPVASVARFLEFGTSKMPARGFMRGAFESKKTELMTTIVNGLKAAIDRWTK